MPENRYRVESLIEARLLRDLLPMLHPDVGIQTQRQMQAGPRSYRVDLCLWAGGRVVIVESDGREYHDFARDRERDVDLLTLADATDVIRFRGTDITYNRDRCLEYLRRFAGYLFDPSAPVLTGEEFILASLGMMHDEVKPIVRCHVNGNTPARDVQTMNILAPTPAARDVVCEFKTPYWDWQYRGPKIRRIGDIAESFIEEKKSEHGQSTGTYFVP